MEMLCHSRSKNDFSFLFERDQETGSPFLNLNVYVTCSVMKNVNISIGSFVFIKIFIIIFRSDLRPRFILLVLSNVLQFFQVEFHVFIFINSSIKIITYQDVLIKPITNIFKKRIDKSNFLGNVFFAKC